MKILLVIPSLRGGGAERVASLLSQEWAKSHEVTIAVFDDSEIAYDYGGRIVNIAVPASNALLKKICNLGRRGAKLRSLILRERPDRIVSFMESANFSTILASILAGSLNRLTISSHDTPEVFPWSHKLCMFLLHWLPARWIAVSEGMRRGMASTSRLPLEKISFVPNPVVVKDSQDAARETMLPLPGRYILGVGRLAPQKGFDRLLRTFHLLGRPNLHLAILGEGPERESLLRMGRELGLENRLHLPGFVADLEAWYRHADCFVLSSSHEGWPLVVMEALANGCPTVSFDCDFGPSEILGDGKWGLLIPEGDVEALAGGIARVLDDDALRRRLATEGPKRAREFSAEKIAPRWLERTEA